MQTEFCSKRDEFKYRIYVYKSSKAFKTDYPFNFKEIPVILSSLLNVTNLEASSLLAVVGGTIVAKTGANIIVECPVKGKQELH